MANMALHRYTLDIEHFAGNRVTVTVYRNDEQISESYGALTQALRTAAENIAGVEDEEMHVVSE